MYQRSASDVVELVRHEKIEFVDFRFCDLPGLMHHVTFPASRISEATFADGFLFDGSSIRGFQAINESDMLLIPDPNTATIDPFRQHKTLAIHCFVKDPVTGEHYSRDPRFVAAKAEQFLRSSGLADTAYFGPEPEFFIFDDVRFDYGPNRSMHVVDSVEADWNSGREEYPNLGYKPRVKGGYFPLPPMDHFADLRGEMVKNLQHVGIDIELHHHEVATSGQSEIGMRFAPLLEMADTLMLFKYIVKNTAHAAGKTVTFMPKPIFEDNGSGMHCHQSLWKDGTNLFWGDGYANLSDTARWYIGGILRHAPAVLAFGAPTTNSYKRLVPGYEAPVNLVYSQRNRSAACRIPMSGDSPKAKRVEFRCPDASSNPYLAFAAMMMAGVDGIINKIEPPSPVEIDLFEAEASEIAQIPQVPPSLEGALNALEADSDFLRAGGVFSDDLIETHLSYKRQNEVDAIRLRPHPYEFRLYYDI